ncbi:hypothetical protein ABZ801_15925 [Actinomadura sp. NPDC047616]|uniref:DUF6907 domain-containing protein n=1 Tax=Actinomadura sp. NPDC047616 TaxID=3155914 RepID=UPI0033C4FB6A
MKHRDTDHPENRQCENRPNGVPLSLGPVYPGGENHGPEMAMVNASLEWAPREISPRVVVSMPSNIEDLTIEEAEAFAQLLALQIDLARRAAEKEVER